MMKICINRWTFPEHLSLAECFAQAKRAGFDSVEINIAEEGKVAIGVENVWNKFLLSPLEFARFLDEIGSPYIGAYFDAGNVLVYGFPDQWIRILGSRIKKVHVKDFQTNIGNITGFCNP